MVEGFDGLSVAAGRKLSRYLPCIVSLHSYVLCSSLIAFHDTAKISYAFVLCQSCAIGAAPIQILLQIKSLMHMRIVW